MIKLKRILSIVLAAVIATGIVSFLFGCFGNDGTVPRYGDPWKYKKEDQGFYYAVYSKEGKKTATILGLVDEEKETEELVIPEKLGGFPVSEIGAILQQLSAPTLYYGIEADKIKNIIINHTVTLFDYGIMFFYGNLIINSELKITSTNYVEEYQDFERGLPFEKANSIIFNIDKSSVSGYEVFTKRLTNIDHCEVVFQYSDDALKTNSILTKRDNKLTEPQTPTKEGYLFEGWCKDEECRTEWNFEEDTVTENITLYAKWLVQE